uniref:YycJ-like protein n=1 Tax=Dulem virus 39 TaxID=3145757 RepID=A0AAU8B8H3_9CAUD
MFVRCIGSGSSGNSYALVDNDNKILLLELGMSVKEIKRAIDYRISDVVGAVITHAHLDHSRSVKDFESMGIPILKPYEERRGVCFFGKSETDEFIVKEFDLTDKDGHFKHTNADGTECPCYGFLIQHPDMGRLLYITDTELVKWRFKDINHILISCNYQSKYITDDDAKRNHVLRGHMELETVKEFVRANKSNALRNVILCHLSQENANAEEMVAEVKKVAGIGVNVDYAEKGKEWELNEFPF